MRVGDEADAQQLLGEVLADEGGGADAVDVDAAGGGEGGDGGGELGEVEGGGGVGEGLRLLVGQLGDDVREGSSTAMSTVTAGAAPDSCRAARAASARRRSR